MLHVGGSVGGHGRGHWLQRGVLSGVYGRLQQGLACRGVSRDRHFGESEAECNPAELEPRAGNCCDQVYVVDLTPSLVNVAKKRVEEQGWGDRVTVLQGDATDPLLPGLPASGSVDIVTFSYSLSSARHTETHFPSCRTCHHRRLRVSAFTNMGMLGCDSDSGLAGGAGQRPATAQARCPHPSLSALFMSGYPWPSRCELSLSHSCYIST